MGLPGMRICCVERRPRTVLGRPDSVFWALSNWACKMAMPMVTVIAVNAVPIKVPATPSFDVKSAANTEASPAAIALFVSTSLADCCCCCCSGMMLPIVAACYWV